MSQISYTEVKVGALVVIAIMLIVAISMSLTNIDQLLRETYRIRILVPSAVGLDVYSPVTYAGVRVGTIVDKVYNFEEDQAEIIAEINADSRVSLDSNVQITAANLLAPPFIEIRGGSKDKRLNQLIEAGEIEPENVYLQAQPYASIGELFALANDFKPVLKEVEDRLAQLEEPFGKVSGLIDQVSEEIRVIFHDLDGVLVDSRPLIRNTLANVNGFVEDASQEAIPLLHNLRAGSDRIPGLLANLQGDMQTLLKQSNDLIASASPDIAGSAKELRLLLSDFRQRIQDVNQNVTQVLDAVESLVAGNRTDIDTMIDHMRRTTQNLDDLTRQLSKDPWRAIWRSEGREEPLRRSPQWNPIPATPSDEQVRALEGSTVNSSE